MNIAFLFRLVADMTCAIVAVTLLVLPGSAIALSAGQADVNFGENENGLQILEDSASVSIFAAAAAPGGGIYATGSWGTHSLGLLKLDADGRLASESDILKFDPPTGFSTGWFLDVKASKDGSIVAVGYLSGNQQQAGIACKIKSSGELDVAFAASSAMPGCLVIEALDIALSVAIRTDGGLIVGGTAPDAAPSRFALVHVDADGKIDPTFADNTGVAGLPPEYATESFALRSELSGDDSITTLASVEGAIALVRHRSDGVLDTTFSDDGAMTVAQYANPVGMTVSEDGSIILALIPDSADVRELTLLKFTKDGNPDIAFQGPDAPPGRAQIAVCGNDCSPTPTDCLSNVLQTSEDQLVIGASTYYPTFDATRAVAVRIDQKTGQPDLSFGHGSDDLPAGVGRGIAVPGKVPYRYCSVLRGDRLTVLGEPSLSNFRLFIWGFLGDRLMSDGFE